MPDDICPNCGWPLTEHLSRVDIVAVAARLVEGDGKVVFIATRTGPSDRRCSVDGVLGGTADLADFADGTSLSGTLNWDAGDESEHRIEVPLKSDSVVEADETVTVTLSNPAGCTIGAGEATTIIANDDVPTVDPPGSGGYDENLPYGGLMLGAACQDGGPGNQTIRAGQGCALVMHLESLRPIVALQTENRVDHFELGSTAGGYSDHTVVQDGSGRKRRALKGDTKRTVAVLQLPTGGDLRWRVARMVANPGTTSFALEKDSSGNTLWAGQTRVISKCGCDASWNDEWQRCGGSGDAPSSFGATNRKGAFPTIWFEKPIDPKALGWKIGDRIAYCPINSADDTGPAGPHDRNLAPPYGNSQYSSVNMAYRGARPIRKSTYPYLAYSGCWWDGYRYDGRYIPLLLIGHQGDDGKLLVKGNGYVGYASAPGMPFGGVTQLRQVIRIPDDPRWDGRRLIGADASIFRQSTSIAGSVFMSVSRAGQDIGGAADQGTMLGKATWKAADILVGDLKNYSGAGDPHRSLKLGGAVTVKRCEAYYVTLATFGGAGQFAVGRAVNLLARAGRGLLKPDHQNDRDRFQTRPSKTGPWQTNNEYYDSGTYLTLGVALFFAPART